MNATVQKSTDLFAIRVSSYDRIIAWLGAFILLVGVAVIVLFVAWLCLAEIAPGKKPVVLQQMYGNDDRPEGIADDIDDPGVKELPQTETAQLSDSLQAVTEVPSMVKVGLAEIDGRALEMSQGIGLGDRREKGVGPGDTLLVPDWARWRIEYSSNSRRAYAAQLDHFGIDVGAVNGSTGNIVYVNNHSAAKPNAWKGSTDTEKRIYFSYNKSQLRKWDRDFLKFGGFNVPKKWIVVQFYPAKIRAQLLAIEKSRIGEDGNTVEDVEKTVFRVRGTPSGYEYYVHDIRYRLVPE